MAIDYNKFGNTVTKNGRVLGGGGPRDLQKKQSINNNSNDSNLAVIEVLKEQIKDLTRQLSIKSTSDSPDGFFSSDYVNEEISKAVKDAVESTKSKTNSKIEKLQEEIKVLKQNDNSKFEKDNLDLSNKVTSLELEIKSLKEKIEEMKLNKKETIKIIDDLKTKLNTVAILEEKLKSKDDIIKSKDEIIETLKVNNSYNINESFDTDRPSIENIFVDPLESGSGDALESFIKVEDLSHKEKEDISDKVNKLKNLIGGKLPNRTN